MSDKKPKYIALNINKEICKLWLPEHTHLQVDTGLGFTVDEDILPIIKSVYALPGFKILRDSSCQNTRYEYTSLPVRRQINIIHSDVQFLLDLFLYLKSHFNDKHTSHRFSLDQVISISEDEIFLGLYFSTNADAKLLEVLQAYGWVKFGLILNEAML
jgi:hypothetical protein